MMRAFVVALTVAGVAAVCTGGHAMNDPSTPCKEKKNASNATSWTPTKMTPTPSAGVDIADDKCSLMTTLNPECGNSTKLSSCGFCQRGDSLMCLAGNKKGPDDVTSCCDLWRYDGFEVRDSCGLSLAAAPPRPPLRLQTHTNSHGLW